MCRKVARPKQFANRTRKQGYPYGNGLRRAPTPRPSHRIHAKNRSGNKNRIWGNDDDIRNQVAPKKANQAISQMIAAAKIEAGNGNRPQSASNSKQDARSGSSREPRLLFQQSNRIGKPLAGLQEPRKPDFHSKIYSTERPILKFLLRIRAKSIGEQESRFPNMRCGDPVQEM